MATSRVKPAARPAMPTTATPTHAIALSYIRLTLAIDTVVGAALAPPPVNYFFRWIRAGEQVKVTAARPITPPGTFSERMSLYARVHRPSRAIVADTGTEPLETTLVLVSVNPAEQPAIVSSCDFDMAHYLAAMVDSQTRSMNASLHFQPDITVTLTIAMKAMGENFLKPYISAEPRRLGMRATTPVAQDADEVAAALEIEHLRNQNRPAGHNPISIDSSSGSLALPEAHPAPLSPKALPTPIMPITATTPAEFSTSSVKSITDVEALHAQIIALEEDKEAAKRDRLDADRKINRHIVHAKKIKETYTQLATWYNNLRKQHMELQANVPQADQTAEPPRASSNASSSTYDGDAKKTDDEKSVPQQQQQTNSSESRAPPSRNSQLLEAKSRTLIELRDQWGAAQKTLRHMEQQAEEHTRALSDANQSVDQLKAQLAEKETAVSEKDTALTAADGAMKEMAEAHTVALAASQNTEVDERVKALLLQMKETSALHDKELASAVKETNESAETARELELRKLGVAKEEEIEVVRQQVRDENSARKEDEFARVREEHESALRVERSLVKKASQHSESTALESESQLRLIQGKLDGSKAEFESQLEELQVEKNAQEATLQEEIQSLDGQRNELSRKVEALAASSTKAEREALTKEDEIQILGAEMQKECEELRHQVSLLKNENDEIRISPRHVEATATVDEPVSVSDRGVNEIAELKSMLRAESDKRQESATLLESADREHDELREMVTRLRSERDSALDEVQRSQDKLTRFGKRPAQAGSSQSIGTFDVLAAQEQRDDAMRELFRVRKGLNKELRQLRQEAAERSSQSTPAVASREVANQTEQTTNLSEQLSNAVAERDQALADLQQAKDDLGQAAALEAEGRVTLEKSTNSQFAVLEAEIVSNQEHVDDLETALINAKNITDSQAQQVNELEKSKVDLIEMIESAGRMAEDSARELENKNDEIRDLTEKVRSSVENDIETGRSIARLEKERETTRNRCGALETELMSLKKSLDDVSSSTSSQENLLQVAQKENAEKQTEITLLQSELEDALKTATSTESSLKMEMAMLESKVTQASLSAEQSEAKVGEITAKLGDYRSQLETERSLKESETLEKQKLEDSLQNTQQKRSSVSNKLEQEQSLRRTAEMKVVDLDGKVLDLERTVDGLNGKVVSQDGEISRTRQERDDAKSVESTLKEQVGGGEAKSREQAREIKGLQEKLTSTESAREILHREAFDAGGKSERVVEELDTLRGELEKARSELRDCNGKLDVEVSKAQVTSEKNADVIKELKNQVDAVASERTGLEARCESLDQELHDMRGSHGSARAELDDLKRRCGELEESLAEKETDVGNSSQKVLQLREDMAQARGEQARLEEMYQEQKEEFAHLKKENSTANEERSAHTEKLTELEWEIGTLQDRIRSMHGEHEERMATERMTFDREMRKMTDIRKDLRTSRGLVESLQAKLQEAEMDAEDLRAESERKKMGGDARDSVVHDLIENRVALANAQDEIIQLRNKLKKVSPKSPGSTSFDFS